MSGDILDFIIIIKCHKHLEVYSITTRRVFTFATTTHCLCTMLCASALASSIHLNPGTYEITVETLLPNLEENLRYTNTHYRKCFGTQDVTTLFPILHLETFTCCVLVNNQALGDQLEFTLNCKNMEAATETARMSVHADSINGVINIKMGGKNMTFTQRIKGTRLGVCEVVRDSEFDQDGEMKH